MGDQRLGPPGEHYAREVLLLAFVFLRLPIGSTMLLKALFPDGCLRAKTNMHFLQLQEQDRGSPILLVDSAHSTSTSAGIRSKRHFCRLKH
jgi:hypothetical protein